MWKRLGRARGAVGLALVLFAPSEATAAPFYLKQEGDTLHVTNIKPAAKGWTTRDFALEARRSRRIVTAPEKRDRSPDRFTRYDAYLLEAAFVYKLPVALLRAVAQIESDFDPNVESEDGAMGLMQLMPRTARKLGLQEHEFFEPRLNVLAGARLLRMLANRYGGDLVKTVASYNAGTVAVARYDGVPPFRETRRYVTRVLTLYVQYRDAKRG